MRIPFTEAAQPVAWPRARPSADEAIAIAQVMEAIRLLRTGWPEAALPEAALPEAALPEAALPEADALAHLREENAVLTRELAGVQRRTTRLVRQQAQTIEALRAALVRLRADLIARDTLIATLREQLHAPPAG